MRLAPPRDDAAEADAVADEQLAAERREEDDPLHHADEPGREVGALERVARVLEAADEERDAARRRTGCSGRAPRRRCRCSRSTASGGRSGRRRACARSRRPGSRRRARRSRRRSPSPRGSCGACECPHSARRAASRRAPAPRSRSGCASRGAQSSTATRTAMPAPSGSTMPPRRWIVAPGHNAESGQRLRGREHARVEPLRVPPVRLGVEDQVRQQVRGDVVEHQRRDDLVRLEEGPQDARDQPPQRRRPRSRPRPSPRSRPPTARPSRRDRAPLRRR